MKKKLKYIEENWGNEIIYYYDDSCCMWKAYTGGSHILDNPQLRIEPISACSFEEMLDKVVKNIKLSKEAK